MSPDDLTKLTNHPESVEEGKPVITSEPTAQTSNSLDESVALQKPSNDEKTELSDLAVNRVDDKDLNLPSDISAKGPVKSSEKAMELKSKIEEPVKSLD